MQVRNPFALQPGSRRRRPISAVGAAVLGAATIAGGLIATALPAFADVTTNAYTIGAPSGAVGAVTASPSAVGAGAVTNFEVTFELPSALSGPGGDSVTVTPSTALASTPTNVDIVGGACIQAGTAGVGGAGSAAATGLTLELSSTCSLNARPKSRSGLYRRRAAEHRDYALQRDNVQERYLWILQLGDHFYLGASAVSGLSGIRRQYHLHDKRHNRGQCQR